MHEAKAFIFEAIGRTSYVFSFVNFVVKSIVKIIFKLDALKEKKVEFDHPLLAKKQTTQRLSEL